MPDGSPQDLPLEARLPFLDLRGYQRAWLGSDIAAALAIAFMVVPQGAAYALIAGLPPYMGLYAAALPVIVGSLMRSSRLVVTGPTNAMSVVVGASLVATAGPDDLVALAGATAFLVGLFQILAGALRLGALIDFISAPVLLGFTTGAGLLIGAGQLTNVTRTAGGGDNLPLKLIAWSGGLDATHWPSVAAALGTAACVFTLRKLAPKLPSATLAMILGTGLSIALDLQSHGMRIVADIHPVPSGLPAFSIPQLDRLVDLIPLAGACTVMSLVESSAIGRSLASRSGQRLHLSSEFIGEGLANLTAAFFGGYPTAGSLSRSALNERAGAVTRLAGALSGVVVVLVLLFFGSLVDYTPIACLAGLLLVVSINLVEVHHIKVVLRSHTADRLAFGVTLLGTWLLHLDQAIYLGVCVSLVLFLQRNRLLSIREIGVDTHGRIREATLRPDGESNVRSCAAVKVVNLEGPLFFGAANQLESALEGLLHDLDVRVLVIRMKRTQHMDVTTAGVFEQAATRLAAEGRALILVGLRENTMRYLERTGYAGLIGSGNLFPTQDGWFEAMEQAIERALAVADGAEAHACDDAGCPLESWLRERDVS